MGNAPSADEMARASALQEQLAELERAAQRLSSSDGGAHSHPVLPHQLRVDGCVISTRAGTLRRAVWREMMAAQRWYCMNLTSVCLYCVCIAAVGVRVLVGPVVGKVSFTSARILLEVDVDALVTCHVSVLNTLDREMHELSQCMLSVRCMAGRPAAFYVKRLLPGRDYKVSFGGIDMRDVAARSGGFRTPSLETVSAVHAVAVSGNNLYDMARCEANLWKDVKRLVATKSVLLVVHLGGQVVMERMFDQSCALLMRHASITASKVPNWQAIEAQAMETMRSAYRTQWNAMPDLRFVLAHTSNLMIWSDMDVYPAFTTRREFYIDHEKPTIQVRLV